VLSSSDVRRLLADHDIRPSKALGQNFVADPNTVRRIVRLAGVGAGDAVVEIGAGLGSLTGALVASGARVVAVESDRRLVAVLDSHVAADGDSVRIVEGDALRLPWRAIEEAGRSLGVGDQSWSMVANLPYSVATPVVVRVLEEMPSVRSLLVMVQREVGERLAARPGHPAYGAVSVKVTYWAEAEVAARVPSSVFVPRPRVESVLVRMSRRRHAAVDPAKIDYERLFRVVQAGFAQRRKMLRRSLRGVVDARAFDAVGVTGDRRAEELDLAEWARLAGWAPQ
jgi:16S rRNA (adenine1518-N6/adenine1519-N6)-dimethyltransferase